MEPLAPDPLDDNCDLGPVCGGLKLPPLLAVLALATVGTGNESRPAGVATPAAVAGGVTVLAATAIAALPVAPP